ncbi:AAA family ATPase [Streptococcus anginosus]|uniref:AAA family ATPase n=1 Tax=Streptococcus anginosus TaxID=1328 RepID=UPI002001AFA7|nr:AAA family ATPase [Streptococcus anginosus]
MENCIYIISGPPGVGKSTVSKELATTFDKSAVIEGDMIYLMVKSGLVAPWEDDGYYMDLFWDNIISLTKNFMDRGITVVIEYVIFEEQLKKIADFLKARQINLKYCVLLAEEQTLRARDLSRKEIERTGDLSITSRNEFLSKNINQNHLLYTDHLGIKETVNIIKSSNRFFV